MPAHPDVLIIGAGVIGLTTAYFLARDGVRVQVVDQGELGQEASWAGAGILVPASSAAARTPLDRLHARSVHLLPVLSAELKERTGIDNGYLRCGGLEFGGDHASGEWRKEGIAFERLDEAACRRLEPALASGLGPACYLPDMAQLRNPRHLQALRAGCEQLGVSLRPRCPVHGFERKDQRIVGVQADNETLQAGQFLIAAGAWSDQLLGLLGWRPGIYPVRGQIALFQTGTPLLRAIVMQGKNYLVPRDDGRLLVGSTEEDVGFDKRTTEEAIAELAALARTLVPALRQATLERSWAGLRPGSRDGLPYLGPVPGLTNLYVAAGHFRSGIQLSAGTALLLKELLRGEKLTMPVEAFRLDRSGA